MPKYTFQLSKILEGGDPHNPNGEIRRIKARSEERARKHLPAHMGRTWHLIEEKD